MNRTDDHEFGGDTAKIARHLDAAEESLTVQEARVAQEVRSAEAWLAARLNVETPDAVLLRVGARMSEELARRSRGRRRAWRLVLPAAGAAAAAVVAAVVVLSLVASRPGGSKSGLAALTGEEIVKAYLPGEETPLDVRLASLNDEVLGMFAELSVGEGAALDQKLDALDEDLERFWQDLTPAGSPVPGAGEVDG
jgi:hypothetical protein